VTPSGKLVVSSGILASGFLLAFCIASGPKKSDSEVTRLGLVAFRLRDKNNQSCNECHSPDGIELSAFNFPKADIIRRASLHLDAANQLRIADYLLNQRKEISGPKLDSLSNRPLQPGGAGLSGNTAPQRDASLLNELATKIPRFFGKRISTLPQALNAENQLLKIDPRTVKVGIQFNRLSEDTYHGKSHATLADWIPDVPVHGNRILLPYQIQYLHGPSIDSLRSLDQQCRNLMPFSALELLAKNKYRSLLLLQNAIRKYGSQGANLQHIQLIGDGNPFWDVAEVARQHLDTDALTMGLPANVLKAKSGGPMLPKQMFQIELPWFWAGWCLDPSLTHSGLFPATRRGDYFCKALWNNGPYPVHMLFAMQKRMIERYGRQENWPKDNPTRYEIEYSFFLMAGKLPKDEPIGLKNRKLFETFAMNCFRVSLLLSQSDLSRCDTASRPESQIHQVSLMKNLLMVWHGTKSDLRLCDLVSAQLKSAIPIRH